METKLDSIIKEIDETTSKIPTFRSTVESRLSLVSLMLNQLLNLTQQYQQSLMASDPTLSLTDSLVEAADIASKSLKLNISNLLGQQVNESDWVVLCDKLYSMCKNNAYIPPHRFVKNKTSNNSKN